MRIATTGWSGKLVCQGGTAPPPGESIGNMGENIFYARRPMCQMNYARNIESDGTHFGERAK